MKSQLFRLIIIFCAISACLSCEKLALSPDPAASPEEVFDYLWEDINNRYTYFEEKNINWDSVGVAMRAKIHGDMSDIELFQVLGKMLFVLKDGHVNLTSSFDRSRNWEWFENYHLNYSQNLIDNHYLGLDFRITGPLHNTMIDSVLYVNYRSFTNDISAQHLDRLMDRAAGLRGVIIDVRSNGGGKLSNAYALASCFADQTYVFAEERIKTGPGTGDFSDWRKLSVKSREGKKFLGSVIVLTNRKSYSATTFFAQMMKTLPNAILMGDNTGGGGGVPAFGELPNGWKYRFSASQTINPEGDHIEFGVPVDVFKPLISADEQKGIDSIIEAALELFE
jgi:hypothetical protein